jgi:hypothetical protein
MINKTYKQYVLDIAFDRCPVKKKSIYTYSYYYDMFLLVLEHVNSWRSLAVTLKYSGKSKYHYTTIRKMFNDCETVIDSIKHLDLKRSINLITDKGYMTKKCDKILLLKNYKIKLITPRKKNQKNIRISKIMRSKLKVRNKVENCIQSIKRFNRTMVRKDRKLHNYMGFVYITCGLNLFNKITVN